MNTALVIDRREALSYLESWDKCYLSEQKKTGFVATLRLPEGEQRFWGLNDLEALARYVKRYQKKSDIFLSLNGFEYGKRTGKALKQIRNIGIDIDCYKKGLSADECIVKLRKLIEKATIPNPNLLIESGKGIQLVYSISGGASPEMAYLTQYITTQFVSATAHLGADTKATDVTRVLRFPHTINQKYGLPVSLEMWRTLEYSLSDLYDYVVPLEETRKKKRKKSELVIIQQPKNVISLYNLNTKKKNDLDTLVTLRNGAMTGYRNDFLYSYCFTVGLLVKNQEGTIAFARQANARFTEPLLVKEVETVAKSAYEQSMTYFKAFSENGYNHKGLPSKLVKPEKAQTLIEKFQITEQEQRDGDMRFCRGKLIKREQNTTFQRTKRREAGMLERSEYLDQQKEKTEDKLWQLQTAIERRPKATQKELAELLGVSDRYIRKLLKQIQKSGTGMSL